VADDSPPHRNVRVDGDTWKDFGAAVGIMKRSAWLRDFIEAVNHAPQAWRDFRALAEARGDTFPAALARALRLYRDA
jgi:hypothetical protein